MADKDFIVKNGIITGTNTLTVGSTLTINTTGVYSVNAVNASAHTVGTSSIVNSVGVFTTGVVNAANITANTIVTNNITIANLTTSNISTNTIDAWSYTVSTSTAANQWGFYTSGTVNAYTGYIDAFRAYSVNATIHSVSTSSYVNATGFWTTGTVNAASANITTINAASHTVGSVTIVNATGFWTTGTVNAATVNAASHTVGTSTIANATGFWTTGTVNAATVNASSLKVGTSTIANATGFWTTGTVNAISLNAASLTTTTNTVTLGTAAYLYTNGSFGVGTSTPNSKFTVVGDHSTAANSYNGLVVSYNSTQGASSSIFGGAAVAGYNPYGFGVLGNSSNGIGVIGSSLNSGVGGFVTSGTSTTSCAGVFINQAAGIGVTAKAQGAGPSLVAANSTANCMTVFSNGYVGIGTTSPNSLVTILSYDVSSSRNGLTVRHDSIQGASNPVFGGAAVGGVCLYGFGTLGKSSNGIGAVGTSGYFGTAGYAISGNSTSAGGYFNNDSSGLGVHAYSATGWPLLCATSARNVFWITNAGAGSLYGALTQNVSDERLKENIKLISDPIEKIKQLKGITYVYNDLAKSYGYEDESEQVGLLSQDVEKVLPQVVVLAPFDTDQETNESKSGENYQTIQYEKIVPLLVEAIKEQQKQIDELKRKLGV